MRKHGRERFAGPLWASGFRPFFLLGTSYAIALMLAWALAIAGVVDIDGADAAPLHWHAREMLFGFAAAIVAGVVLTALPSWPGTEEIRGGRLAFLAALWLAGRAAFWSASWWPSGTATFVDALFLPALFLMVGAQLLRVANRRYLVLLPVLASLYAAQWATHLVDSPVNVSRLVPALHGAVYAIVVLYVLVGGLLTPVFTGNALRAKGRGDQARFLFPLEVAGLACVVALAWLDVGGADAAWVGTAAIVCTLVHGWRVARWRGWRASDEPIVLAMNLGFAWLVFAFALRAASALGTAVPATAWIHAFTVGSLGMMMLGLMTRVVLRHTGRPVVMPRSILVAGAILFAAALLRLAASVHGLGDGAMAIAALLWALAFGLWFAHFARWMVAPSLPRQASKNSAAPNR